MQRRTAGVCHRAEHFHWNPTWMLLLKKWRERLHCVLEKCETWENSLAFEPVLLFHFLEANGVLIVTAYRQQFLEKQESGSQSGWCYLGWCAVIEAEWRGFTMAGKYKIWTAPDSEHPVARLQQDAFCVQLNDETPKLRHYVPLKGK